jgi:hypothetical protein
MKRLNRSVGVISFGVIGWTLAVGTVNSTAALALSSAAGYSSTPVPTSSPAPWATNAVAESAVTFSAGVGDVLRMVDAKVDPQVIRTFVENSTVAYNLSAAEIIALKTRGVPDDLVASMIARGAQLRAKGATSNPSSTTTTALPPAALVAPTPQAPAYSYEYLTVPTYPAPSYNYDYPVSPPYYYDYSWYNYGYPWGWYGAYWPIYTYYGGYYGGRYHGDQHPGHPGRGHPGDSHPPGARGGGPPQSQPVPGTRSGSAPSAPSAPRAPSASGSLGGRSMGSPGGGGGARSGGGGMGGGGGRR